MGEGTDLHSDPAEVVRRFINGMHDWEVQVLLDYCSSDSSEIERFWTEARSLLGDVFARWCTPKERKYGRLGYFSEPPEYQPEHETVLETVIESPRRACVYTQQGTGFRHKRMYILLKKSDRWLIDSVKWWQGSEGKWATAIL